MSWKRKLVCAAAFAIGFMATWLLLPSYGYAQTSRHVKLLPSEVRVIDADTIMLRGKTRVRAIGYDTPETGKLAKCERERVKAAEALRAFNVLVSPPNVFTLKWAKGKDRYGRSLARFYSNHKPIGPILIAQGLAHDYGSDTKKSWCDGFSPSAL